MIQAIIFIIVNILMAIIGYFVGEMHVIYKLEKVVGLKNIMNLKKNEIRNKNTDR